MRILAAALVSGALILSCVTVVRADEVSKTAKIEEFMQVAQLDRMVKAMLDQMKNMQAGQLAQMSAPGEDRERQEAVQRKTMALIAERMSFDKIKPLYVKVYAETFTEEELDGMLSFYKSPAGKAMMEKMPQMMARMMPLMQQWMADMKPDLDKIMAEGQKKPN
jgi:uncharacterized protein